MTQLFNNLKTTITTSKYQYLVHCIDASEQTSSHIITIGEPINDYILAKHIPDVLKEMYRFKKIKVLNFSLINKERNLLTYLSDMIEMVRDLGVALLFTTILTYIILLFL